MPTLARMHVQAYDLYQKLTGGETREQQAERDARDRKSELERETQRGKAMQERDARSDQEQREQQQEMDRETQRGKAMMKDDAPKEGQDPSELVAQNGEVDTMPTGARAAASGPPLPHAP